MDGNELDGAADPVAGRGLEGAVTVAAVGVSWGWDEPGGLEETELAAPSGREARARPRRPVLRQRKDNMEGIKRTLSC